MVTSVHLAIDLGAESGRAIVGVLEDGRVWLHESYRFGHLPQALPGGLYWDLQGLWTQVLEGLGRSTRWLDGQRLPRHSVGVDTWGLDWVLLGGSGEILGLPHCYRDPRHQAAYDRILAALGPKSIYAATGIQPIAMNTLFQLAACHQAEPDLLASARYLLFMPDLFHFMLTGNKTVERSIASTSQMLDSRTGQWAKDLLGGSNCPPTCWDQAASPALIWDHRCLRSLSGPRCRMAYG